MYTIQVRDFFYPWVFFQEKKLKPSRNHWMFFEKISSVKKCFFCLVDVCHFFVLTKEGKVVNLLPLEGESERFTRSL